MTIGLALNVSYFHSRICILAFVLYIICASDGSKYKQDIQKLNRQFEESVAKGKRTRATIHHENRVAHIRTRNSEDSEAVCESDNSHALKAFLENVLKAQNELKWIDQVVHSMKLKERHTENSGRQKSRYSSRSAATSAARREETRGKSGFNTNRNSEISPEHRKRKYGSHDSLGLPERIYSDEEMKFKTFLDKSDFKHDREDSSRSIDKPINEGLEISKDLFSNRDDFKLTHKKFEDNEDRCARDKSVRKDFENSGDLDNSVIQHELSQIIGTVSLEKSQTMKEANVDELPLSLETVKQTVLKQSKSPIEFNKGTNGNVDVTNIARPEEYETQVEEDTARKEGHAKSEHKRDMSSRNSKNSNTYDDSAGNVEKGSNWWDDPRSAAEIFDFQRREDDVEDANDLQDNNGLEDEKNNEENEGEFSHLKEVIQRVKREEKDNEEEEKEDLKLFHRAGFGELSPEILNDRRRSSKKSLRKDEKKGGIEVHSQSLIRQTTENNTECSVESPAKLLIDNSVVLNKTFDSNSESQNQKENEVTNLIQNNNKENQTSSLETKTQNKNLRNVITEDKDKMFEIIPNKFNETLLIKNYQNETHVSNFDQNVWNAKDPKIIFYPQESQIFKLDQFNYERNNKTANNNIIEDPGLNFLLDGKSSEPRRKLLRIAEDDGMVKVQRRKGRKILQKRFGKSRTRSQKDENVEDDQDEELEKLLTAQNEKLEDIGYDYEDKAKENIMQNYNDNEEDSEDYENEYEPRERSKTNSLSESDQNAEYPFVRKRYVPIVQYYDYEEGADGQDVKFPIMEQINFETKDSPGEQSGTYVHKKNKQKEEEDKLDKDKNKSKNKTPVQEFAGNTNIPEVPKNETFPLDSKNFPFYGKIKRGKKNEDEESVVDHKADMNPHIWSDQSAETQKLLKALNKDNEDSRRVIFSEPLEYNLKVRGKLKAGAISNFLSKDLPLEERLFAQDKDLLSFENNEEDYEPQRNEEYGKLEDNGVNQENDLRSTYEELEKVNDWKGGIRERPRLRGDQRMDLDSKEVLDTRENRFNKYSEGSRRNWYQREPDRVGQSDSQRKSSNSDKDDQIFEKQNCLNEAQDGQYSELHNTDDKKSSSGSSYLALKSTDDMFKGGVDQSNPIEENPSNELDLSQGNTESKVMKVADKSTNLENKKTNTNQLSKNHLEKPIIKTDFICQSEKIENPEEIVYKKKKDANRDQRSMVNSDDLIHESFVESLDWMNDFGDDDDDKKRRLGRGLKSFQENTKITNDNTSYTYSSQVQVSTEESNFENKTTVTNIIEVPVDNSIQNLSVKQNLELTKGVPLKNTDFKFTFTTKSLQDDSIQNFKNISFIWDKNIKNNVTDTFPANEEQPEMEQRRVRREANYLHNAKSKYGVGNQFSNNNYRYNQRNANRFKLLNQLRRQNNQLYRTSLRNHKNRNRRHRFNHGANVKDWFSMKKYYSPEDKYFDQPVKALKKRNMHLKDQKNESPGDDSKKRKIDDLLKVENIEDDSQVNLAANGKLAAMIVEKIFEEVQQNEALKKAFGHNLYRTAKIEKTVEPHKFGNQTEAQDELKKTEDVLQKIMKMLENVIHEEIRKQTCMSLTPEMQEFLEWMLEDESKEKSLPDQSPPHETVKKHRQTSKNFLFHSEENNLDLQEMYKIVRLLKSLIDEYNTLGENERTKVHSVHNYLEKQLSNLVKYIEIKEAEGGSHRSDNKAYKKLNNPAYYKGHKSAYKDTLYSFENEPSIMNFQSEDTMMHRIKKRNIQSVHRKPHRHKKHKKRRRKHRKHKKHKHKPAGRNSREYRKMEHRNRQFRRKRANMDDADWDSDDSGYEKRGIYSPDSSDDEGYGYSFKKARRDSTEKSNDLKEKKRGGFWTIKGKNKTEDETILLKDDGKVKERFEKFVKKQIASGEETPEIKNNEENSKNAKLPWNFSGSEVFENKRCCSGSITPGRQNKASDKKSNGFWAMILEFIGIVPLNSADLKCNCDEKNVVVEDEVRKMEEKTNVYPETTESMDETCFQNSENISMTTIYSESSQNLPVNYINETGYLYDTNFDYINKHLKNTEFKYSDKDRKIAPDFEKLNGYNPMKISIQAEHLKTRNKDNEVDKLNFKVKNDKKVT